MKKISPWFFVLLSIVLSEIFTAFMSVVLRQRVTYDYMITGGVVSLFVSSFVCHLIIRLKGIRESLKESLEFSRTILNSMNEAVCVIDVNDFRLLSCNKVFIEDMGYKKEEDIIGKTCYEITHHRSSPCVPQDECPLRKTVQTGEYAAIEHIHFTKDGNKKYVKVTTSPIKDKDGTTLRVVHVAMDVTETKELHQELERLATTDRLTETYNRTKYEEIMEVEMEKVRRYGQPLSLIMFDIDYFKETNDRYGHMTGDNVLKSIANIVREHKRTVDYLFRWGGEEFVIVAPETDLEQAASLAERLREVIEGYSFDDVVKVTVSFGITKFHEGDTNDSLITRVDAAMYKAKNNGRNRVEII
jgi:diguanylate cyclase (GGDEF)-like protein/PAS domain S-box-containing protein